MQARREGVPIRLRMSETPHLFSFSFFKYIYIYICVCVYIDPESANVSDEFFQR